MFVKTIYIYITKSLAWPNLNNVQETAPLSFTFSEYRQICVPGNVQDSFMSVLIN